jgi:hypothetical protein
VAKGEAQMQIAPGKAMIHAPTQYRAPKKEKLHACGRSRAETTARRMET